MPERYQQRLDYWVNFALDFTHSHHAAAYKSLANDMEDALTSPLSERVELADGLRRMLYAAQNPHMSKEFKATHVDKKFASEKFKRLRIQTLRKGVLTSLRLAAEYNDCAKRVGHQLQVLAQFGGNTWTGLPAKTDIDDSVARWVFDTLAVMAHPNTKGTSRLLKLEAINAFGDAYRHLSALGFAECAKPYDAVIHMYRVDDRLNPKLRAAACNAFKPTKDEDQQAVAIARHFIGDRRVKYKEGVLDL